MEQREDSGTIRGVGPGGLEIQGLGRLSGSRAVDHLGNEIPLVRDIEYIHRVGEPPIIRVTCFASGIDASGKLEISTICARCGHVVFAEKLRDRFMRRWRKLCSSL